MRVELKVPESGESITEVQVARWIKSLGEFVKRDEPVVEIETDKATIELPSPVNGVIVEVRKQAGEKAVIREVIALIEEREVLAEPALKEPVTQAETAPSERIAPVVPPVPAVAEPSESGRTDRVVRMSPMRKTIAARLVAAQQNAALLTTFNEIDMGDVQRLRKDLQEDFQERYDIKLGIMSFFVKAAVAALKQFPELNAEIRDDTIVYHNFYDVGIAVSSGKGLMVPVLRDADRMTLAIIERRIADFAARAKENKIAIAELEGGTFTISNGGVFGSLLSTPIVNPPQSGVLGMHAIQDRPVAREGQVIVRPMMYVALTYDHRIVDGREAVTFLKTMKEYIEKPTRLLLEG